jgi:hypothetical protein
MKGWTGKGAVYDEKVKEYGGYEAEDITSVDDLISKLELTKALSDFDIKEISLAYAKQLTQEPVFVFDGVDKKTNHRKLIICDKTGQSTLYDK